MQETRGSIPGMGKSHMLQSNYAAGPQLLSQGSRAWEPQLLKSMCPRAHVPQQEKPPQRETHALQLESSPCLAQLEKNTGRDKDPAEPEEENSVHSGLLASWPCGRSPMWQLYVHKKPLAAPPSIYSGQEPRRILCPQLHQPLESPFPTCFLTELFIVLLWRQSSPLVIGTEILFVKLLMWHIFSS